VALLMSIVEYPSLVDAVVHSLIIDVGSVVLDGGVYNQSSFVAFADMFIDGSIFDGGKP
jgi:hypothetical protein